MSRVLLAVLVGSLAMPALAIAAAPGASPYDKDIDRQITLLKADEASVRAGAAEILGVMRSTHAERLLALLEDPAKEVRREAALALAWCGTRASLAPLLEAMEGDDDWLVRQGAWVSLTNLSGMEFPYDAVATPEQRTGEVARWRHWLKSAPADGPPAEVLVLGGIDPAGKAPETKTQPGMCKVRTSSIYKGPQSVIVDGILGGGFWQTKDVPFPQWCEIELPRTINACQVIIHQHSRRFVMTDYEVSAGTDRGQLEVLERKKEKTPVAFEVNFKKRPARFVRITSYDSINRNYPTTFFEVEVNQTRQPIRNRWQETGNDRRNLEIAVAAWQRERALRAMGVFGGKGASQRIISILTESPPNYRTHRTMVQAGFRSLGLLREEDGFQYLVRQLGNPMWARAAAEALGDFGDSRAVEPLIKAYAVYAKNLSGGDSPLTPRDDKMSFPSEDRMHETPWAIALALSRLPIEGNQQIESLREICPLILANIPGDHDAMVIYQPEPALHIARHLLQRAGMLDEAREHVFSVMEKGIQTKKKKGKRSQQSPNEIQWPRMPVYWTSAWLPTVCTSGEDIPRLTPLLDHPDGWVRINAAKAMAFIGDRRAIEPIASRLIKAKTEADFGFSGVFKDEEFNDPAPRWREALVRALGILQAREHVDLIVNILDDQCSVLEVRRAAADALADLGGEKAEAALRRAAMDHSFLSVRNVARDALRLRGIELTEADADGVDHGRAIPKPIAPRTSIEAYVTKDGLPKSIVFIKGSNSIPNTLGTVEQADRWRLTYCVTDSGPVYRPGRNLYILSPPTPDGQVTPLTEFKDGYVGEPEVSWDGSHILFVRRGEKDPWWHIWRINTDGTGLKQITRGPYHYVGPCYLPDGRIICASSRLGIRDEYHGYPCTGLWRMNADGTGQHPVATNIGRDNEPAVLPDGRVVFSRLEVFYSRNKTELTLHAIHPDGTKDAVLYGPERRHYWAHLDHGPRTPADRQEAWYTHRVVRPTQPQPMPDGRSIVVTTQAGLTLVGPRRDRETLLNPDYKERAWTTPEPLPDGRILCASTLKKNKREEVDLGLYLFDPETAESRLIYNDPASADFEPRAIMPRRRPPVLADQSRPGDYSGRMVCTSVFQTQEPEVIERGRLVRLIEGVPVVGRHSTQTNPWPVWKNHGGTLARVLGTVPLASDGSFNMEVPADRLLHFQVLDSDRHVVSTQLTWIYSRPGERKSCVGCHERPHETPARTGRSIAARMAPVDVTPNGDEFRYRAKAWHKGTFPLEIDGRMRTVRSVSHIGR